MRKSKYVENCFCTKASNGIYSLTFNTTERWIPYHQYNDEMYIFGPEPEDEPHEEWESRIQEVPKFLPKIKEGMFISAVHQNKDQITWYFIPYYFKDIVEENIFNINNKE